MARKIFGTVFAVTGALSLLGLTGVPYLEVGVPGILSLYFDIFSGGVQALVFSLLTMVYVGNACPPRQKHDIVFIILGGFFLWKLQS